MKTNLRTWIFLGWIIVPFTLLGVICGTAWVSFKTGFSGKINGNTIE
jgi:hypothetical protein